MAIFASLEHFCSWPPKELDRLVKETNPAYTCKLSYSGGNTLVVYIRSDGSINYSHLGQLSFREMIACCGILIATGPSTISGRGIGTLLLKIADLVARTCGYAKIMLTLVEYGPYSEKNNRRARLLKRMGYSRIGRPFKSHKTDNVIGTYEKILALQENGPLPVEPLNQTSQGIYGTG